MSEPQTQQRAIDVGREVYSLIKEMLGCYFPDMPSSEILRVGVAAQDAVRQALSNEADQTAINLARLQAMRDLLADVDFTPVAPVHRMPSYVIGVCRLMVADVLADLEPDPAASQLDNDLVAPVLVR